MNTDALLVQRAQMLKTGANVHRVSTAISLYVSQCDIAADRPTPERIALAEKFERELRELVGSLRAAPREDGPRA